VFGVNWQEVLLIVLIVLLLFGAKRIPEVMRSLGKGVRELKQGMKDIDKDEPAEAKKDDQGPKAD
jgi:sec-independent protein translocase protein TatA